MAKPRILIYEDRRGWRYYWREGDVFAHMLRPQLSRDLTTECVALAEHGTPPDGSVSSAWTAELVAEGRVRLIALYDTGRGELHYHR